MQITKKTNSYNLRRKIDIESIQIDNFDLHAYMRTITTTKDENDKWMNHDPLRSQVSKEAIVSGKDLEALYRGDEFDDVRFVLISDDDLELARTKGFCALEDKMCKARDEMSEGIYTRIKNGALNSGYNLVRFDISSHMMFDANDQPYPTMFNYDYISSGIDESSHDLAMTARVLCQRHDINVISGANSGTYNSKDKIYTKNPLDAIFDIPSYNSEDGRTLSVQFEWIPTKEKYKELWNLCLANGSEYPSTAMRQEIAKMDVFGLNKMECTYESRERKNKNKKLGL